MSAPGRRPGTRTPDATLLQELRDCAAQLGRTPLVREYDAWAGAARAKTLQVRFGSWPAACRRAGLAEAVRPASAARPDDDTLLDEIRAVAAELGRSPSARAFDHHVGRVRSPVFQRRFGGWAQTLERAGLEPFEPDRASPHVLIEELRECAGTLGHTPSIVDFNRFVGRERSDTVVRAFGSWAAAIERAGMEVRDENKPLTRRQLLEELRECADVIGRSPTVHQFDAWCGRSRARSIWRIFGGWDRALLQAGLRPSPRHRFTPDDLLDQIRGCAILLDAAPTSSDFNRHVGSGRSQTIAARFGSFQAGVRRALADDHAPEQLSHMAVRRASAARPAVTQVELVDEITRCAEQLDRVPTRKEFDTWSGRQRSRVAVTAFGGWRAALDAAGLATSREQARAALVAEVETCATELGHPPTLAAFSDWCGRDRSAPVVNYFNGWRSVLLAAGLNPDRVRTRRRTDDQTMLEEIRACSLALGRQPTAAAFDAWAGRKRSAAIAARFGGWRIAVRAAGPEVLTARQQEVLDLARQGFTAREIAERDNVSRVSVYAILRAIRERSVDVPSPITSSRRAAQRAAIEESARAAADAVIAALNESAGPDAVRVSVGYDVHVRWRDSQT